MKEYYELMKKIDKTVEQIEYEIVMFETYFKSITRGGISLLTINNPCYLKEKLKENVNETQVINLRLYLHGLRKRESRLRESIISLINFHVLPEDMKMQDISFNQFIKHYLLETKWNPCRKCKNYSYS